MKKLVILMTTLCLIVFFGLPSPAIALQNETVISEEEQAGIDRFYADLEDAYDAINQGEGGYHFYNLNTGEMVTYDLVDLFENEFETHQYDEISQYCNENQIAIVIEELSNNVMPFACIGEGCTEGSPIVKTATTYISRTFVNPYYLNTYGTTIYHTASVSFTANYHASPSTNSFLEWISAGYLVPSTNSTNPKDKIVLRNIVINLQNSTQSGYAEFDIYS